MSDDPVLSAKGITKSYGPVRVLDGVDLTVRRGEILGFLGPNGAGKTTMMKIVMGLERADTGSISLLGEREGAARQDIRRRIGYLQEKPPIYPDMTARAYLTFFARMYRVRDPRDRVARVLERVGLTDAADRRLGGFSRGMQQRTCLARVMLHEPEFLLLDEPTLGLDPVGVADMRKFFLELQAEGTTLMFSSHQLSEMERICSSLILLASGKVIASGPADDLLPHTAEDDMLMIEIAENAQAACRSLEGKKGISRIEPVGERLLGLSLEGYADLSPEDLRALASRTVTGSGFTVLAVNRQKPGLEELFLMLTNGTGEQSKAA